MSTSRSYLSQFAQALSEAQQGIVEPSMLVQTMRQLAGPAVRHWTLAPQRTLQVWRQNFEQYAKSPFGSWPSSLTMVLAGPGAEWPQFACAGQAPLLTLDIGLLAEDDLTGQGRAALLQKLEAVPDGALWRAILWGSTAIQNPFLLPPSASLAQQISLWPSSERKAVWALCARDKIHVGDSIGMDPRWIHAALCTPTRARSARVLIEWFKAWAAQQPQQAREGVEELVSRAQCSWTWSPPVVSSSAPLVPEEQRFMVMAERARDALLAVGARPLPSWPRPWTRWTNTNGGLPCPPLTRCQCPPGWCAQQGAWRGNARGTLQ